MNTLTQYGMMAEKHWREHRPKMVRELEAKGQLQEMLLEAERKTKDEMAGLRTRFIQQGLTPQQAQALRVPALVEALQSKDQEEGVKAFQEKRAPQWKGA